MCYVIGGRGYDIMAISVSFFADRKYRCQGMK